MKIICVGRNYANHAKELNNPIPSQPLLFSKPQTALHNLSQPLYIPEFTNDLHYEVELVVKISKVGKGIEPQFAHKYYTEIGLGIDFTARDIQAKCKEKGWPWERAKAFDSSAILSKEFIHTKDLELNNINFKLVKNGETVQEGNSKDMLFSIDNLVSDISKIFTLKMGDLIYTGTPEGVGKVEPNDELIGYIGTQKMFELKIK